MSDVLETLRVALAERYAVERELGHGGMATVYLAEDLKHQRRVAVKLLRPELAASLGTERFLREIAIAAQLQHPHILMLIDSGEAAGFLYYVMPYVEGESLRDRLQREGPLALEEAVQVAREVADALAYAHSRGVVHRDIKPENILLTGGHAVVADFGIARAIGAAGAARLTETGIAVGTPAYMSPEQTTGERQLDGRSDVYSLGCVLYELLVGEPPFTGPSAQAVLARHSLEPVPSVRVVRPAVPPAVEAAIVKALAKTPADRFPTALQFSEALSVGVTAVAARPARSRRARATAQQGRWRTWRWPIVGGATILLAAAAAMAYRVRERRPALAPRRVVVGMLDNRTGDPGLDDIGSMAADWITQGLQRTGIVDVIPSPTALQASHFVRDETIAGRVRNPVAALGDETGAGTVISGAYYREGGAIQFHVEVTDVGGGKPLGAIDPVRGTAAAPGDAIKQLRERVMGLLAVAYDERLAAHAGIANRPPTFEAYQAFNEGLALYIRNAYRAALPHFSRAFALDPTSGVPLLYAAFSRANLGERAQTDSVVHMLEKFRAQLNDYDREWLEYLQAQLAGDRERALRAMHRAAAIAPGSKAAYNLAYVALQLNRPREALAALGTLDPERGPMRGWLPFWGLLTDAYHRIGDHGRELKAAQRARRLYPDRASTLRYVGEALAALGRVGELDAVVEETSALQVPDEAPGAIMYAIALELRAHGHDDAARALLGRAIRWFEALPPGERATENRRSEYAAALSDAFRYQAAESVVVGLAKDFSESIVYRAWLGHLAARRADDAQAKQVSGWLATVRQPYLYGAPAYYRARIAAVLGDRGQAAALLRTAFAQGYPYPRHLDWNFDSVRTYPPVQELMKPRG